MYSHSHIRDSEGVVGLVQLLSYQASYPSFDDAARRHVKSPLGKALPAQQGKRLKMHAVSSENTLRVALRGQHVRHAF